MQEVMECASLLCIKPQMQDEERRSKEEVYFLLDFSFLSHAPSCNLPFR